MGDLFYLIVIIAVCVAIYIHVKRQGKYREQDRLAREAYEREQQEKTRLAEMEQQERERREFNEKYKVLTFPIAGLNFRSGISRYIGEHEVRLVEEPDNEFDPEAIKIIAADGNHIGYVPRDRTAEVRAFAELPIYGIADIDEDYDYDDEDNKRKYCYGKVYLQIERNTNKLQSTQNPS